jgi:chromosomal replication initiation ATPase DnaA
MVVLQDLDDLTQGDEESLFHVLNHIRQSGQKMLLVSRAPAARLDIALPDLASRLKAVPAVAMGAPDDVLLGGLLGKLFADRQIRVSDKVIAYMVPRMERDFAAMGDLVNAIDQRALERQKPVTVPLVAEVMSNLTVAS